MKAIRVMALLEASTVSGSAKAVLEFAREAARAHAGLPQIELSIATFDRGQGENPLARAIRETGAPHDVLFERRRFDTRVIGQLRAAAENRRADLVWSNSVKSHFLVRQAGLNRIRRWAAFHHGYTATDLKMRLYNQFDRWSLPAADQVLTSSAAFVQEIERQNVRPGRIHVQHMPIRPFAPVAERKKTELRRQLRLEDGARVLLCVGRMSREKGHADLILALPLLREQAGSQPLRLLLVGEGPERVRIEELCRRLELTEMVTLAGQQDDVNPYYAIADVFVLPSRSEGCSNALLEAMAAGVPVVAADAGGISEVVTNGENGLLVKKNSAEELASAAARLLEDGELRRRLISSAREIVSRKTPDAFFQGIASVFQRACANDN
ncbi:MAG: glycosyltransferase [Acidobacteriia bacterium]|nr:glycosyltransferase [Terriglobia bacterium]